MSYELMQSISLQPAPAPVAAKRFVTLGVNGVVHAGANSDATGISLQESPDATAEGQEESGSAAIAVCIPNGGKVEIEAGATLAQGDLVTSAANGRAAVAGSGEIVLGVCLHGADANGIATILFAKGATLAA